MHRGSLKFTINIYTHIPLHHAFDGVDEVLIDVVDADLAHALRAAFQLRELGDYVTAYIKGTGFCDS